MADELTISTKATLTNGLLQESFEVRTLQVTQTTAGSFSSVVNVGTSIEDLTYYDISTEGWIFIRNLDDTNYVTYGPSYSGSFYEFGRINAGEFAVLRLEPGTVFSWVADTAPVKVKVLLLED